MSTETPKSEILALRAVAAQYFINGVVAAAYIPRLPEIRENLNIDFATLGQVITAASMGGLLASLLCSKLVMHFGTKNTLIFGSLALIILLPNVALAPSVWALVAVMCAITFADVIVDVAVNIQGSILSARRATPVINRLHGLWSIGTVAGGLVASALAATALPLLWHLIAVSALLALCLWYVASDLLELDLPDEPTDANNTTTAPVLNSSRFWLFGILGACAFVPEMILSDWSPFRLRDDLGASEGMAGLAYVAFGCGMVTGRMGGDWVSARVGKAHMLRLAIALAGSGLILACFIDWAPVVYLGLYIAGLGVSVLFPTLYDNAARDKGRRGAALGAMTAGSRGAMLLAPLTIGSLANSPNLSVGMAIACVAPPCLLLVWWLTGKVSNE